ncbi:MAG: hypothetical protein HC925_08975 [Coleofasciculaceae cyanobacterium SM2_3_26]|nr:hypothetical protein [Coleofasciculaceae cyanobacterium SM2_3_26]
MNRLEHYRTIIQQVLHEHTQLSQRIRAEQPEDPNAPVEAIAVCDPQTDNYLLITDGWKQHQRIHSILAHFRIVDECIYIQWNGVEDLIEGLIEQGISESALMPALNHSELPIPLIAGER